MCEGCGYWHGDYHRDRIGRSVEKIEADITHAESILTIREHYKAVSEGYPQRTAAIRCGLELDRETLELVKLRIAEHESGKTSVRGSRNSKSEIKNGRRRR